MPQLDLNSHSWKRGGNSNQSWPRVVTVRGRGSGRLPCDRHARDRLHVVSGPQSEWSWRKFEVSKPSLQPPSRARPPGAWAVVTEEEGVAGPGLSPTEVPSEPRSLALAGGGGKGGSLLSPSRPPPTSPPPGTLFRNVLGDIYPSPSQLSASLPSPETPL